MRGRVNATDFCGCNEYGVCGHCSPAPTLPPSKADDETRAFEQLVRKVGEGQARWTRLLELLEEQAT